MSDFIAIEYGFQLYLGIFFLSIALLAALSFFSDEIDANIKGIVIAPIVLLFLIIGLPIILGAILTIKAFLILLFLVVSFIGLKVYFFKKNRKRISNILQEREQKIKLIKAKIKAGEFDIIDDLVDLATYNIENEEVKFIGRYDIVLIFGILFKKTKNIDKIVKSMRNFYDGIPKYKNTEFEEDYKKRSNRSIKDLFYDEYKFEEEDSFINSVEKNINNQNDKDRLYEEIISSYLRYDRAKSENLLSKIKDEVIKSDIEFRIKEEKDYELKIDPIKDELEEYQSKSKRRGMGFNISNDIINRLYEDEEELKFNTDGKEKMKFSDIYDQYARSLSELRKFAYDFEIFENKTFTNRPCYPLKNNSRKDILSSISKWNYEVNNNIICLLEDSEIVEYYNDEKLLDMYKAKGFNVIHFPINKGKKVSKKQFLEIHKIVDELQGGTLFHSDKGGRAMEIKAFYENEAVGE